MEFDNQDFCVFEEIMEIIKSHSEFEQYNLIDETMLSISELYFYPSQKKVLHNSLDVNLTTKEFDILYLLALNQGRVLTYDQIYRKVWNEDTIGNEKNAVKCHIRNIREKLDVALPKASFEIKCVREVGYCFEVGSE